MGDDAREDTDELLNRLRALGAHEMLRIGELPPGASAGWPALTTDQIIILAIRRAHYLARHPDMLVNERHVISTLRHPDQIRMDKDDPQTVISICGSNVSCGVLFPCGFRMTRRD